MCVFTPGKALVIKHCVYDGVPPPGLLPTPFVCWHEKERREREEERVAVSRNRVDTFLAYSSKLRFCHATTVSRIAGFEIAILKKVEADHSAKDGDDFYLATPQLVAKRNGTRDCVTSP